MLVLTRKPEQDIVINGNIVVRILSVERDRVKIGIIAPRDIPVLRGELLERDIHKSCVSCSAPSGKNDLCRICRGD